MVQPTALSRSSLCTGSVPNFQHVTLSLPQADNQPNVYFRWFSTTASHIDDVRVSAAKKVPEPSTGALVGLALLGLWLAARRRGDPGGTRLSTCRALIHHVPLPRARLLLPTPVPLPVISNPSPPVN